MAVVYLNIVNDGFLQSPPSILQRIMAAGVPQTLNISLAEQLQRDFSELLAKPTQSEHSLPTILPIAQAVAPAEAVSDSASARSLMLLKPVCLYLQRDHFVMGDAASAAMTQQEFATLTAVLQQHLPHPAMRLYALPQQAWVLVGDDTLSLPWQPATMLAGHNILPFLPKGKPSRWLQQWLNELQMVLYDHPINQQRENSAQPPINSVWVESAAAAIPCPENATSTAHFALLTDNADLAATATMLKMPCLPQPQWLTSRAKQRVAWLEQPQSLQDGMMQALLWQLRVMKIKTLYVRVSAGQTTQQYTITPRQAWQFWKYRQRAA